VNRTPDYSKPDSKQLLMEMDVNARVEAEKGCLAMPAPTLPVSLRDYSSSRVGAGLLDSQHLNAGEREVVARRKTKAWKTPQPVPNGTGLGSGVFQTFPWM
jgi:hypothetical protein